MECRHPGKFDSTGPGAAEITMLMSSGGSEPGYPAFLGIPISHALIQIGGLATHQFLRMTDDS